jgi:hypothetical protein
MDVLIAGVRDQGFSAATVRIPAKANSIPEGSRTPFRREAEQHSGMIPNTIRSAATLAF